MFHIKEGIKIAVLSCQENQSFCSPLLGSALHVAVLNPDYLRWHTNTNAILQSANNTSAFKTN